MVTKPWRARFESFEIPSAAWLGYCAAVATGSLAFWVIPLPLAVVSFAVTLTPLHAAAIALVLLAGTFVASLVFFAFGFFLAFLPFLIFMSVAVIMRIRRLYYYVACGGLISAAICFPVFSLIGAPLNQWRSLQGLVTLAPYFFLVGSLGGLVFWLVAIRPNGSPTPTDVGEAG